MKQALMTLICLVILFTSCNQNRNDNFEEVSIPVSVKEVKYKPIKQFIETSGTVYSTHEALLRTEIAGKYKLQTNPRTNQPFKLGDKVEKDEVIIVLEDKEYENSLTLESKKLNLDITKRMFEKQKSLYEKGGVTIKELTDAERSYIDAKYSYENALIGIEKLNIKSPFKGIIVELPYYTPTVKINSGNVAAKVMDYENLYFEINLPEKELKNVDINQKVRVYNYSYPTDTFAANISQLSPVINPESRSFKGFVTVKNSQLLLRPGMFVKAEIITASKDSAIVIPRNLVLSKYGNLVVYVVEKENAENKSFATAVEKKLTIGLQNPNEMEVTDGLKEGDRLIIRGYETLRDKSKVKVVR